MADQNKHIHINFDLNFDGQIITDNVEVEKNKTIITFSNVTDKFYHRNIDGKIKDKRYSSDPQKIKQEILNYLLIKLFLLKKQDVDFEISILCEKSAKENPIEVKINPSDIPKLDYENFLFEVKLTTKIFYFNFIIYLKLMEPILKDYIFAQIVELQKNMIVTL